MYGSAMAVAALLRRRALSSSCRHGQCPLSLMPRQFLPGRPVLYSCACVGAWTVVFRQLLCLPSAHLRCTVCVRRNAKTLGAWYAALLVSAISIHLKVSFILIGGGAMGCNYMGK